MLRWVATMALGGLVAYFTAQGAMQERLSVVETTERLHYDATVRTLQEIKDSLYRQEDRWSRALDAAGRGVDRRTNEPVLLQDAIERRGRAR